MLIKHLSISVFVLLLISYNKNEVSYLDQEPPGTIPELFAPSVVNTDSIELNAVFNNSFTEFFFTRIIDGSFVIQHSELVNGEWTAPQPIEMFPDQKGITTAVDMTLTPDGNTMYFLGRTPEDASLDIYMSQKVNGKWQQASRVPEPISTEEHSEIYPVVVADGSLYFVSDRGTKRDIYRAQYLGNGKFDTPVNLGPVINSEFGSGDAYVDPDESFIIYVSNRPKPGMYVSFKENNEWQEPIYLDKPINSEWEDFCPYMTPDKKYFSFSRLYSDPPGSGWNSAYEGKVYWVDAKIIFDLKDK